METKTCLYCGDSFTSTHGNLSYCPGKACSMVAKLERQNRKYPIGSDAKKAIQRNHILFMNLLGDNENGEFDLLVLLKMGFDHNGYYGSGKTKDTKMQCFVVHDYYFHITNDNPQKIKIWKRSMK
jgi:hypothetical protein